MKIVCVQSPLYDYLTATVIEGLLELGHDVISSEDSNYGVRASDRRIKIAAENAELIIVFSNKNVRSRLLDGIDNDNKVFVDGSDFQEFGVDPSRLYKAIFKRELNLVCEGERAVFPLPFAAERRYFKGDGRIRDLLLSFAANLKTNPLRNSIQQRLLNRCRSDIFAGSTGECAYAKGIGRPVETPAYRELLFRSKVGVNVAGAGYDCGRYWEILASGAMLLTQELDIKIPNPFVDGESCIVFKSLDDFDQKVDQILSRSIDVSEIAHQATKHLLNYHTSRHRAQYLLNCVASIPKDQPPCLQFYVPKKKNGVCGRIFNRMFFK